VFRPTEGWRLDRLRLNIITMQERTHSDHLRLENWKNIMDWLVSTVRQLPEVWPPELPPERTKDFGLLLAGLKC